MLVLSMTLNIVMYSFPNEQFLQIRANVVDMRLSLFVDILASTNMTHKTTHRGTYQRKSKLSLSNCRRCSSWTFTHLRKS